MPLAALTWTFPHMESNNGAEANLGLGGGQRLRLRYLNLLKFKRSGKVVLEANHRLDVGFRAEVTVWARAIVRDNTGVNTSVTKATNIGLVVLARECLP